MEFRHQFFLYDALSFSCRMANTEITKDLTWITKNERPLDQRFRLGFAYVLSLVHLEHDQLCSHLWVSLISA